MSKVEISRNRETNEYFYNFHPHVEYESSRGSKFLSIKRRSFKKFPLSMCLQLWGVVDHLLASVCTSCPHIFSVQYISLNASCPRSCSCLHCVFSTPSVGGIRTWSHSVITCLSVWLLLFAAIIKSLRMRDTHSVHSSFPAPVSTYLLYVRHVWSHSTFWFSGALPTVHTDWNAGSACFGF